MRIMQKATMLLCLAAAAAAFAQDAKPVTELRFATATPGKSIWGTQAERWARTVEEESGGTLRISLFPGAQLGADADLVQQVARGRIDAAAVGSGFIQLLVPEAQLLLLPFFFRSPTEMDCAMDRQIAASIDERLAAKGVKVLRWGEGGTLDFAGKRAFANPADVAGAKAGVTGIRATLLMWEALGANPTVVSFPEIPNAFQTGLIDIAPTVPVLYVANGTNKVAPVLSRVELFYGGSVAIMNKAVWDRLGAAQRAAFERTNERIPLAQLRREVRAVQQQALEDHVKGGGQVVNPTEAHRAAYRRMIAPLWPKMAQEAGPEGPKFFASMEQARKACEAAS